MSGFYLMHRGWQDNPVFRNEEFSRRDAFVWLIEQAAYKATRVHSGGGTINLARGQLSHSLRFMAKVWKWDEARVRRFIVSMQKEKIIDASADAGQTVITICNYERYQTVVTPPDAATDAAATQRRRSSDAKNKEVNEVKEDTEVVANATTPRIRAPAVKGNRLSPDWQPEKPLPAPVIELCAQWPPGRLERELDGFRDYWTSRTRDAAKLDWDKAWWNRIRDQHDRVMKEARNGRQLENTGASLRGKRPDPCLDLLRQSRAELEAETPDPGEDQEYHRGTWAALSALRAG